MLLVLYCFVMAFGYGRLPRTCTLKIVKHDLNSDPPVMALTVINKGPITEDCWDPLFKAYQNIVTESDDDVLFQM